LNHLKVIGLDTQKA